MHVGYFIPFLMWGVNLLLFSRYFIGPCNKKKTEYNDILNVSMVWMKVAAANMTYSSLPMIIRNYIHIIKTLKTSTLSQYSVCLSFYLSLSVSLLLPPIGILFRVIVIIQFNHLMTPSLNSDNQSQFNHHASGKVKTCACLITLNPLSFSHSLTLCLSLSLSHSLSPSLFLTLSPVVYQTDM